MLYSGKTILTRIYRMIGLMIPGIVRCYQCYQKKYMRYGGKTILATIKEWQDAITDIKKNVCATAAKQF